MPRPRRHHKATLAEYIADGCNVHVECACRRISCLSATGLAKTCAEKGWPDRIDFLMTKLRCSKCGRRPQTMRPRRDVISAGV